MHHKQFFFWKGSKKSKNESYDRSPIDPQQVDVSTVSQKSAMPGGFWPPNIAMHKNKGFFFKNDVNNTKMMIDKERGYGEGERERERERVR